MTLVIGLHAFTIGQVNDKVGYRLPVGQNDVLLYLDNAGQPDMSKYLQVDHSVYIRRVGSTTTTVGGTKYVKVRVPGPLCIEPARDADAKVLSDQGGKHAHLCEECKDVRARWARPVDRCDYNYREYWIAETDFDTMTDEYVRYKQEPVFGIITLPWIYRFERGDLAPIMDGGFSLAASFGWRVRLSNSKPVFFQPAISAGVRTFEYTAANNTALEADNSESATALSFTGGILFEFAQKQVGLMLGTDSGLGKLSKSYVYDGAPWICFTLGIALFEAEQGDAGNVNK